VRPVPTEHKKEEKRVIISYIFADSLPGNESRSSRRKKASAKRRESGSGRKQKRHETEGSVKSKKKELRRLTRGHRPTEKKKSLEKKEREGA